MRAASLSAALTDVSAGSGSGVASEARREPDFRAGRWVGALLPLDCVLVSLATSSMVVAADPQTDPNPK